MIRLGPVGIGGVKEAEENLQQFKKLGISAVEIAFTYNVYMTNEQAKVIGAIAKKLDIQLTIHAPYFINLASKEKIKIEQSKKRILLCCERGHYLQAEYVVFHGGYYQDKDKEEIYQIIKKEIIDLQETIKKNKWNAALAPETTGKASQFGSLDELLRLKKETGCHLCIDYAHLLARNGKIDYEEVFQKTKDLRHIHAHFSGIVYGEKGEKHHILTEKEKIKELLHYVIKNNVDITIINESPDPLGDSVKTIKILGEFKK